MEPDTTTADPTPVVPTAERLRAAARVADGLTEQVLAGCPPLERLLEVLGELDRLNAEAVALVDDLQRSGEAEEATGLPLELWLSIRGRQVRSDRRMHATTADLLERLPSLRQAFRHGQVSWGQVRQVVLEVRRLPAHLHDSIDHELARTIPATAKAEPDALIHAVSRAIASQDPEPDDREEDRRVRERFVALQPTLDGSGGSMYGEFDPAGFAVLDAWFAASASDEVGQGRIRDRFGEEADEERGAATHRERGRRRADRLVERLATDLTGDHPEDLHGPRRHDDTPAGPAPDGPPNGEVLDEAADDGDGHGPTGRARPRPTLLLRLPYEALLGGAVPGDLLTHLTGGRLRLSARAARELVDQGGADLRTIVIDRHGETLGVGRRTRVPRGWLRDAVLARDDTCTAPGCRTAARRCHLDHARRWTDDGPTNIDNLAPLCATDNHARERDGWEASDQADGTRTWHHPATGLTVTHPPSTWRPPPPDRAPLPDGRAGPPVDGAKVTAAGTQPTADVTQPTTDGSTQLPAPVGRRAGPRPRAPIRDPAVTTTDDPTLPF